MNSLGWRVGWWRDGFLVASWLVGKLPNDPIPMHVSGVLFWFVFSSPPNHDEFCSWEIKTPLLQVVLETISII